MLFQYKEEIKVGDKFARTITSAMATWTFIFFILVVCVTEITGNAYGLFHFDPTMLVLNTVLSLWAAVQGSIIMINQNQADKDRDSMMKQILEIDEKLLSMEESHDQLEKNMLVSLKSIEEGIKKLKAGE